MLDLVDVTESPLRLVILKALRSYDVDQLLAWLEDAEPMLRSLAARTLHLRPSDRTFECVAHLCRSKRFETREVAAFVLGQFGTPTCSYAEPSFKLLSELLKDDYVEVQAAAISAIGQLASLGRQPPKKLQKSVLDFADDPRPEIRQAVAYSLLSIDNKLVERKLEVLVEDDHPGVREAAEFSSEARQELQALSVAAE